MTIIAYNSHLKVMVKFRRGMSGSFVTLMKTRMHQIGCNPRHISAGTGKTHWGMVVRAVNFFTVTGHPPQAWLYCKHGILSLGSLFPFKIIVLCSHVPTVFLYLFPISHICLPLLPTINIPP